MLSAGAAGGEDLDAGVGFEAALVDGVGRRAQRRWHRRRAYSKVGEGRMAAKVDPRKLKDQATKAVEKKQYAKAAELYLQIADLEAHDPDWHQRAGEAFRKVPDPAQAIRELERAAEGYAKGG